MKATKRLVLLIVFLVFTTNCSKNEELINDKSTTDFGIFKILEDGETIEMNGVINSSSLNSFNKIITKNPNLTTINIKNCDGSSDDEVNLKLSKKIHDLNIKIHLLDNAIIASGGVDFFLAGKKRTRGNNTRIGVHSWSNGTNEATDFPVGHINHLPYINYYKSIGFSDVEAKAFYYFTINSAKAASIHWMTESEIEQYKILKP
ncbi:hypothetical protein ACSIGC_10480 [Tenacibaculum sp. ZS6-P6]|uniref:hypothetical protein n=1 Tax=Tenacibaculum sp. ZS6-P6 TaxID=3447503 RepID=UPI003F96E7BE